MAIKFQILAMAVLFLHSAHAWSEDQRGFSYFLGVGRQAVTYREEPTVVPVKTRTETGSPILISGALYALNEDVLFSLDAQTTFAPDRDTEKWSATEASFNGMPLQDRTLQTNQFTFDHSETRIFAHYRIQDSLFVIAGPSIRSQSFKRFAFEPGVDEAVEIINGQVIEESNSEVLAFAGVALESEQIVDRSTHFGVRLYTGVPVWREVTNTFLPTTTFTGKEGLDVALEARYSYSALNALHLGVWMQYLRSDRNGERKCIRDPSPDAEGDISNECDARDPFLTVAEVPDSALASMSFGIEVLWKL